jgi:hypothetical protein
MPLLAINLSDTLADQIKPLVEKGLYKSFEAFLEIAAFNQLALERGATPSEIISKGHRGAKHGRDSPRENGPSAPAVPPAVAERVKAAPAVEQTAKGSRTAATRRAVEPVARMAPTDDGSVTDEECDAAFGRLALVARTEESPPALPPACDNLAKERVFGQVNRVLPLKLACRWLATAATAEGKWPRYQLVSDKLADDAATIGTLLERWDTENERKRDDLVATGLPRRGNSASRDRFLSQFLARVTRGGEIYPAVICQYQLARFEDSVIGLTDQGVEFAQLENPILDKRDSRATTTLTAAESGFLARHILGAVPAEREDMRLVLQTVSAGKKTPTDLAEAVRAKFPSDWSDASFQTHLSGLVARLGELRLLKRVWQGRNVNYELGDEKQIDIFLADEHRRRGAQS